MALINPTRTRLWSRLHFLIRLVGLTGLFVAGVGLVLTVVAWQELGRQLALGGGAAALLALLLELIGMVRLTAGRRSVFGTNVVLHREINVGIAVALDWGLIVPVVKSADEKNILGIQRTMNDLAERARSKKLKPEEVQEGTFSITNPGVFGGLFGLPVISQPNVGILGLGAIEKRPVVINDSIAIRSMCYVTLSYDHRVVDGAIAHQFLHKVKETLENWSEPLV